jgi:hypothetical protein
MPTVNMSEVVKKIEDKKIAAQAAPVAPVVPVAPKPEADTNTLGMVQHIVKIFEAHEIRIAKLEKKLEQKD